MLLPPSKVETVHEIILKPGLSRLCVCFCIEESAPLLRILCHYGPHCYTEFKFEFH